MPNNFKVDNRGQDWSVACCPSQYVLLEHDSVVTVRWRIGEVCELYVQYGTVVNCGKEGERGLNDDKPTLCCHWRHSDCWSAILYLIAGNFRGRKFSRIYENPADHTYIPQRPPIRKICEDFLPQEFPTNVERTNCTGRMGVHLS